MKRIGVLTSGGDAPGMNAAVRAAVRQAIFDGLAVTGIRKGYAGLIAGEYMEMDTGSVADIIHRGGTILRTARCEEFYEEAGRWQAVECLKAAGIEGLVVIGGDGSFRGAACLHQMGIKTVCIPATIDNDIAGTDYTLGFDTAVNSVVEAINKIRDTATSHERVFLIEVMGRYSGQIALYAGIAGGAESVLVPELPVSLEEAGERIRRGRSRGKLHSIILVAEGVGSALEIGKVIKERTGLDTRVTILGHIQRGGAPTAFDRVLATRLGSEAVKLLSAGASGVMVGMAASQITVLPLEEVLSRQKVLNEELYRLAGVLSI